MKTRHVIIAIGSICLLLNACSIEKTISRKVAKLGQPFDATWHKELNKKQGEIKQSWKKYIDIEWANESVRLNLGVNPGITEKNLDSLLFVPVDVFLISRTALINLQKNTDMQTQMTLLKDEVNCLMAKDSLFYKVSRLRQENGTWKVFASGGCFMEGLLKLKEIYFIKKQPIFIVFVEYSNARSQRAWFASFIEDGVIKCIDFKSIKTLNQALLDLRSSLRY